MIHKLLATVFDHVKNVDTVSNVSISEKCLIVDVNEVDVNKLVCLVCLGHVLSLTVVCTSSYSNERVIVSFNL